VNRSSISRDFAPFFLGGMLAIVALAGCVSSGEWRAYQNGRMEAERDTNLGIFKVWNSGCCLPTPAAGDYSRLMRERYGITFPTDPCVSSHRRQIWRKGYNDFSERIIEKRWGTNVWTATWAEAERISAGARGGE
jgi:hypothetical protein